MNPQRPLRSHRPRPRLHRLDLLLAHHREDLQGAYFLVPGRLIRWEEARGMESSTGYRRGGMMGTVV